MSVLAVYREEPFLAPRWRYLPEGLSLAEMATQLPELPPDFTEHGVICINGHVVPRAMWRMVRPKAAAGEVETEVTFHVPIRGGDRESGGKNVLAIVASIAITVATGFIAGGGLAKFLGPAFAKGTFGALALSSGVSLAGSLLVSGLTAPPTLRRQEVERFQADEPAAIQGNVLARNAPIPRVVGTRRIYPPLAAEPHIYFDKGEEIIEAVYALAGPHKLENIQINGASPTAGVNLETREGWSTDAPLSLVTRQARTEAINTELSAYKVKEDDERTIDLEAENPEPVYHSAYFTGTPDEVSIQVMFPEGLNRNASTTDEIVVPIRASIGNVTLPELHFRKAAMRPVRATIRIVFGSPDIEQPTASAPASGWVAAYSYLQTKAGPPEGDVYDAPLFRTPVNYLGVGVVELTSGVEGSTEVRRVHLADDVVTLYIDPDDFTANPFEVKIKRGASVIAANWDPVNYQYNGNLVELFLSYLSQPGSAATLPESRKGMADRVVVPRIVAVWNEAPVLAKRLALIAIKVAGGRVDELSVKASGYVQDWDGAGWNTWTTTSNPAPHLRDVFAGALNADPVPAALIDDAGLVDWRAACASAGYTCDAVMEGMSVSDAAQVIAACGYARPYMSDIWGVVRDYDRSAESPVQIFTPRNSANFMWRKGFAKLPDGFLVSFADAALDYKQRQVMEPPGVVTNLVEQITYEGITTEAAARARADFDLRQAKHRNTFYSLDVPAEAIVCRRGSLVGVVHDSLTNQTGAGRVVDIAYDGSGNVTGVTLDNEVEITNEPYLEEIGDLLSVSDMLMIGVKTGVVLRRTDGTKTVHELSNASGQTDKLMLVSPTTAAGIDQDVLAITGPLNREYDRMIVFSVEPREDLTARLTLVDEAPEVWNG